MRFAIFLAFSCVFPSFPGTLGVRQRGNPCFFRRGFLAVLARKKAGIGGSGLGSNALSVKARPGDAFFVAFILVFQQHVLRPSKK